MTAHTIGKILVATDFSPCAEEATLRALDIARAFDASLLLLHVVAVPGYTFFDGSSFIPAAETVAQMFADAAHRMKLAEAAARDRGVRVESAVVEGNAKDEIGRVADERGADLIVVGTHGRRGLARMLVGSVASALVQTARQPVLTVHAPPPAQ